MTNPSLTEYPVDSPAAMLRVIAMFVLCDGDSADREMEPLEELGVFGMLDADPELFATVLDTYCDDLIAHAGSSRRVALVDPGWVDAVLEAVQDPERRRLLTQILLVLARVDGRFADIELAVVQRVLGRWEIELDSLAAA